MKTALPLSLLTLALAGCGTSFASESLVESVRLLAIQADKPYAAPGDTVTMTALAYDGRASQPPPMVPPAMAQPPTMPVFWVPVVCPDPPGDSYFALLPRLRHLRQGAPPGADLSSVLTAGPTFSFQVPEDVISAHAPEVGAAVRHGRGVRDRLRGTRAARGPQPGHGPAGAAPRLLRRHRRRARPRRLGVRLCAGLLLRQRSHQPEPGHLQPDVRGHGRRPHACPSSPSSTAPAPAGARPPRARHRGAAVERRARSRRPERQRHGPARGDLGRLLSDRRQRPTAAGSVSGSALLYDATAGKVSSSTAQLTPPTVAGDQFLWAVVHDNRGGVAWQGVTVQVQ